LLKAAGSLLLLFFIIFFLVKGLLLIPGVQHRLITRLAGLVEKQTGYTTTIKQTGINFPTQMSVRQIQLTSNKGNTILYADEIGVSVKILPLLKQTVKINDVVIKNGKSELQRLFDNTTTTNERPPESSEKEEDWLFEIDQLKLENCHFNYRDSSETGFNMLMNFGTVLAKNGLIDSRLNISFKQLTTNNSRVSFIDLAIQESDVETTNTYPVINIDKVDLKASGFDYVDALNGVTLNIDANEIKADALNVNINRDEVKVHNTFADALNLKVLLSETENDGNSDGFDGDWGKYLYKVDGNKLELKNSNVAVHLLDEPETPGYMNPSHLNFQNLNGTISDFIVDMDFIQLEAQLHDFYINSWPVKNLALVSNMNDHIFDLSQLEVVTDKSQLSASVTTEISPTNYGKIDNKEINFQLAMKSSQLSELLFFIPPSVHERFMTDAETNLSFDAHIDVNGTTNQLNINTLQFGLGNSTKVDLSAQVIDVLNADKIKAKIQKLEMHLAKDELEKVVQFPFKSNNSFPPNISLAGNYSYSNKSHNFTGKVWADQSRIDFYKLSFLRGNQPLINARYKAVIHNLEVLNQYGIQSFGLNSELKVQGNSVKNLEGTLHMHFDSLRYHKALYQQIELSGDANNGNLNVELSSRDSAANLSAELHAKYMDGHEQYELNLLVDEINLYELGYHQNDFYLSTNSQINLTRNERKELMATCSIKSLDLSANDTIYRMHPVEVTLDSKTDQTNLLLSSFFYNLQFRTNDSISGLLESLKHLPRQYFTRDSLRSYPFPSFSINGELKYPEEFTQFIFPSFPAFEQITISASATPENKKLLAKIEVPELTYDGIHVENLQITIDGTNDKLDMNSSMSYEVPGWIAGEVYMKTFFENNRYHTNIKYIDANEKLAYNLPFSLRIEPQQYFISILPDSLIINYQSWLINSGNEFSILTGDKAQLTAHENTTFLINGNAALQNRNQSILLQADDNNLDIELKSVDLSPLSALFINQLNPAGQMQLKVNANATNKTYTWDVLLDDFELYKYSIHSIEVKGWYNNDDLGNQLLVRGPGGNIQFDISGNSSEIKYQLFTRNLNLNSLTKEWLATRNDFDLTGKLNGNIEGKLYPQSTAQGYLALDKINMNYQPFGMNISIDKDTIEVSNGEIKLNNFKIYDAFQQELTVNGHFSIAPNPIFEFDINSNKFAVVNQSNTNKDLSGNLSVSTKLEVKGNTDQVKLNGSITTIPGAALRYNYRSMVSLDEMEEVVQFVSFASEPDKLVRQDANPVFMDKLSSEIDVNISDLNLYVLLYENSNDYIRLDTKGKLKWIKNFGSEPELMGTLEGTNGSVFYDAPMVSDVDLKIIRAAATWQGSLDNPNIFFNGYELFRANLKDVFGNMAVNELVPVTVYANIDDTPLNNMEIHFDIESENARLGNYFQTLPASSREAYAINLLAFGTLSTDMKGGGASLSGGIISKLNEISRRNLRNANLSFYLNNTNSNAASLESLGEFGYTFSKGLLHEKINISVGGDIKLNNDEVADDRMKSFNPFGNIRIDYMLSQKPNISINAIRRDMYKGAIDGQVTESSLGITYSKSFRNIFFNKTKANDE
jgi:hypothetical protein